MSRSKLALIAWTIVLAGAAAAADEATNPIVRRGQAPAEVRERLGAPTWIARQILFRRHVEQWVYDAPRGLRIEFASNRGQEPYVTAVLPTPPPAR